MLRFAEQLRREVMAARGGGVRSAMPADGGGVRSAMTDDASTFVVPAAQYREQARFELERDRLFTAPRIVAASSSLQPGACLPVDVPGRAALLVRGADGAVRAFANACRHRGTRLVDTPCAAKAFVCPYHAWTYDLTGKLVHVPHADAFAGVDLDARGLAPLPVAERDGLIWLGADAGELDHHLGDLARDIAALGLDQHVLWQRSTTTRRCNWKLVIEAFLDGYHIRVLHRDSVYRFFLDAASVAEPIGPHIRAITGRRALLEAPEDLRALLEAPQDRGARFDARDNDGVAGADPLRQLATPSLLVFPSTVFVEHPDFVSIMTVHPLAPNVTAWDHMMIVPAARAGETEHWNRSWQLIEEGVFQREDLWVCEQAQRSIDAGAIDELLFGALEEPARWFHEAIERTLAAAGRGARRG